MLAVRGAMDALQRSTSFNSQRESLMRQPSAEDLDAAHQLVSSARGGRHASHVTQDSRMSDAPSDQGNHRQVNPRPDMTDAPQTASEVSEQTEDSSGLGQICRYVHRSSISTSWSSNDNEYLTGIIFWYPNF